MSNILSAVQPSGHLHLGNYLGAIKHWVELQKKSREMFFCVADLHALTVAYDRQKLKNYVYDTIATYLACGIDASQAVIFLQSSVSEHCELTWLLSCHTPLGWLNRMTQFKEKATKDKATLGLYSYPVLMAADILLYQANNVPVGEDQKQHIELTRDIAIAFNTHYQKDLFVIPDAVINQKAARVMSLRDGSKKMSKSDISDYARINLSDDKELIAKKIKKAKTDSKEAISYSPEDRPEIANFIEIYACLSGTEKEKIVEKFMPHNCSYLKKELTELVVETLQPIRQEFLEIRKDESFLSKLLQQGQLQAQEKASNTVRKVKKAMGMVTK